MLGIVVAEIRKIAAINFENSTMNQAYVALKSYMGLSWIVHKHCSPKVFMDTCVPLFPDRAIPGICIRATIPECARWNCCVFAKEWSGTSEARENTSRGVCTEWLRVTWVQPSLCCTKDWDFPTWYAWYYLEKTTTMTVALVFLGAWTCFTHRMLSLAKARTAQAGGCWLPPLVMEDLFEQNQNPGCLSRHELCCLV